MDNNYDHQGDLTDIIRATAGGSTAPAATPPPVWEFPNDIPVDYSTEPGRDDFGDPFTHFRDPLIHPGSVFLHNRPSFEESGSPLLGFASAAAPAATAACGDIINTTGQKIINLDDEMKGPNVFSRMLQISPVHAKFPGTPSDTTAAAAAAPPTGSKGPTIFMSDDRSVMISPNSSRLVESPSGLQISSPPNTGIRRRRSQAKKVVCIPAPAPVNSRPSGEIVPSDLWAWRKYGQKPIKGSPYPRGYYRCSSSKGCSARKQVERSRTDPNMLVITYTSEHNHPWPTQRNSLAGSTRSQPSKTNPQAPTKIRNPKEERNEIRPDQNTVPSPTVDPISASVKGGNMDHDQFDNQLEVDEVDFDEGFPNSYKTTLPDSNQSEDSFFADLGEIDADSLDFFEFSGDDGRDNNGLYPFSFFDWAGNSNSGAASPGGGATTSYGEANRES
ncbi:WRKY Transcription Factor [Orobanche hederae]